MSLKGTNVHRKLVVTACMRLAVLFRERGSFVLASVHDDT